MLAICWHYGSMEQTVPFAIVDIQKKRMKPVYVIGPKTVYANSQGWTRTQKLMIFCQQNNRHSMLKEKRWPFTYNINNNDAHIVYGMLTIYCKIIHVVIY